jgi:hypothetical protein
MEVMKAKAEMVEGPQAFANFEDAIGRGKRVK